MSEKRYAVTLYHDEPEEASADVKGLADYFTTERAALAAGRRALTDYWQTGDVVPGEYDPPVFGVRPDYFETDPEATPVRFGPGWTE